MSEERAAVSQDEEVVDAEALPVVAEARPIARPAPAQLPAVQAAAVAATGFVAGAATVAIVKRSRARRGVSRRRRRKAGGEVIDVISSRSFLVDVHLINRS